MLRVSADFIEGIERASFSGDYIVCRLCPYDWLRLGVVLQYVIVDCGLQVVDAGVAATPDTF